MATAEAVAIYMGAGTACAAEQKNLKVKLEYQQRTSSLFTLTSYLPKIPREREDE